MSSNEVISNMEAYVKNAKRVLEKHHKDMTKEQRESFFTLQMTLQNMLDIYKHEIENVMKLARYVAVQEDKDFEDVKKEFEL